MCAQNFSFAPSVCPPKMGEVFSPKFCIFGQKFSKEKIFGQFSDSGKFTGVVLTPPFPALAIRSLSVLSVTR